METNREAIEKLKKDIDAVAYHVAGLELLHGRDRMHVSPHDDMPQEKVVKVNSFRAVADVEQIGTDLLYLGGQEYFKLIRAPAAQWHIEISYFAGESRFLSRSEDSLLDLLRFVREIVERDQAHARRK